MNEWIVSGPGHIFAGLSDISAGSVVVGAAVAGGVFGAGSGFHVGWDTARGVWFLFFGGLLLVVPGLSFYWI